MQNVWIDQLGVNNLRPVAAKIHGLLVTIYDSLPLILALADFF